MTNIEQLCCGQGSCYKRVVIKILVSTYSVKISVLQSVILSLCTLLLWRNGNRACRHINAIALSLLCIFGHVRRIREGRLESAAQDSSSQARKIFFFQNLVYNIKVRWCRGAMRITISKTPQLARSTILTYHDVRYFKCVSLNPNYMSGSHGRTVYLQFSHQMIVPDQ